VVLLLLLACGLPPAASAYEVEADSSANTVFILLRNLNPSADYLSVSLVDTLPSFVPVATASIVPASVPASGSDLAAVDFDVSPAALLGETGDLRLKVLGTAAGLPVEIILTVPLEVVATAPVAQGEVGIGIPAPDPGGVDGDGDGVSDALETAYGTDPANAASVPGEPGSTPVPGLDGFMVLALLALFLSSGLWFVLDRPTARWR